MSFPLHFNISVAWLLGFLFWNQKFLWQWLFAFIWFWSGVWLDSRSDLSPGWTARIRAESLTDLFPVKLANDERVCWFWIHSCVKPSLETSRWNKGPQNGTANFMPFWQRKLLQNQRSGLTVPMNENTTKKSTVHALDQTHPTTQSLDTSLALPLVVENELVLSFAVGWCCLARRQYKTVQDWWLLVQSWPKHVECDSRSSRVQIPQHSWPPWLSSLRRRE